MTPATNRPLHEFLTTPTLSDAERDAIIEQVFEDACKAGIVVDTGRVRWSSRSRSYKTIYRKV